MGWFQKLKELIKKNMSKGQKQYKCGLTWGPAKAMKVSRICLPYVELKKENVIDDTWVIVRSGFLN